MKCHIKQIYIQMVMLMNKDNIFKFIFSGTFVCIAVLMICFDWFRARIDVTVIALFVIAFLPWLAKYVKSLEAFGIKTELISLDKKEEMEENISKLNVEEKEVIKSDIKIDKTKPIGSEENPFIIESINSIYESKDIIEKLVLIRYGIEKGLKTLCRNNNLHYSKQSIRNIIDVLRRNKVLKNNTCNLILDLLPILNKAVHSDISNIYENDLQWVIDKGIAILIHLEIIIQKPDAYWMVSLDD